MAASFILLRVLASIFSEILEKRGLTTDTYSFIVTPC